MNALRPSPLPPAYRREIPSGPLFNRVTQTLEAQNLHTICVSGKCPNRGECFSRGSLAFMILGDVCTRRCGFCAVTTGNPKGVVDTDEPRRLAEAAKSLRLRHVVITAVARDDLKDGGASIFADSIQAIRAQSPETIVEVLTSDFLGDTAALEIVLDARPDIFNHNMETVERLTPTVRSKATYRRSLEVLRYAKRHMDPGFRRGDDKGCLPGSNAGLPGSSCRLPGESRGPRDVKTKSGLMLGLGEAKEEILQTLQDLREAGCDYLTIGQYLQPSTRHLEIQHFVPVEDFDHWKGTAYGLGFERVASGPLVRSSYFADTLHV